MLFVKFFLKKKKYVRINAENVLWTWSENVVVGRVQRWLAWELSDSFGGGWEGGGGVDGEKEVPPRHVL